MKKKLFMWIIAILMLVQLALAQEGHISLLTVAESNNTEYGGIADLYLTIKQGTGRIFIDSFPLSKIDTQITTRFAAELSCDFLEKDCSQYDFFYTIRANSAIVGGPSAGAAATVLTTAVLDNQKLDSKTVMTGTISSGNLIGPVAGIAAKTKAAQDNGFNKVIIPKWDIENVSFENLSITVIPVSALEDALYHFTGKNYSKPDVLTISSEAYDGIMQDITSELCSKYGAIVGGELIMPTTPYPDAEDIATSEADTTITINTSVINTSMINISNSTRKDFFQLAKDAIDRSQYYSAASFCFVGNVRITTEEYRNMSNGGLKKAFAELLGAIDTMELDLDERSKKLSTISELETYMIVSERLSDSKEIMRKINPENISIRELAYASERYNTAIAWSKFFELPGTNLEMDAESLKIACSKKLGEAEERINYMQLYFPDSERTELSKAYGYFYEGEYALCIFTASRVKADTDVVLSALFVRERYMEDLLVEKLSAARRVIAAQQSKGVFPILGYSYYEYSDTLKEDDKYSALIYAEYALELSNLDMYFPQRSRYIEIKQSMMEQKDLLTGFALGLLFALLAVLIAATVHWIKKKHTRR